MSDHVGHKRQFVILSLLVVASIFYFYYLSKYILFDLNNPKLSCEAVLELLQPLSPLLLIDIPFLLSYENNSCILPDRPLRVATLNEYSDDRFDIIPYQMETNERNYWLFDDNGTRATPILETYQLGNFVIPYSATIFAEYWMRSRLLECLNINMHRVSKSSFLSPKQSTNALRHLTRLLVSLGMYPFLNGGTLLGWFRECNIINHTYDMDLAVFVDEYNPALLDQLLNNKTEFKLERRLGKINDSFELTVRPIYSAKPAIDIFFMYNEGNTSWVGGTSGNGQKYRYDYPLYNPWCSADLLGHLFWVTCTPEKMIEYEYGPHWRRDHLTRHYAWNRSGKNVKKTGQWTEDEMKTVYIYY